MRCVGGDVIGSVDGIDHLSLRVTITEVKGVGR